jgi:hypothetical protein
MWRQEQSKRPTWWLLYVIGALMVAVVGLAEMLVDSEGLRKVLETLALVVGFGLTRIWVRLNRIALDLERGRRRA